MPGAAWPWKKITSASPESWPRKKWLKPTSYSVAADANVEMWPPMPFRRLVRAHDHRRGVPADEALDAALDVGAARHQRLLVGGNRVDVGRVRGERQLDAVLSGVLRQLAEQPGDLGGTAALQDIIKGIEPFAGFRRVEIGRVFGGNVSHEGRSFRKCRLAVTRPVGQSFIVTSDREKPTMPRCASSSIFVVLSRISPRTVASDCTTPRKPPRRFVHSQAPRT